MHVGRQGVSGNLRRGLRFPFRRGASTSETVPPKIEPVKRPSFLGMGVEIDFEIREKGGGAKFNTIARDHLDGRWNRKHIVARPVIGQKRRLLGAVFAGDKPK